MYSYFILVLYFISISLCTLFAIVKGSHLIRIALFIFMLKGNNGGEKLRSRDLLVRGSFNFHILFDNAKGGEREIDANCHHQKGENVRTCVNIVLMLHVLMITILS